MNRKTNLPTRTLRVMISLLAIMSVEGCARFDLRERIPWGAGEDGKIGRPVKVTAFWTDTILTQGNGDSPQRGFGGRLMFYEGEGGKPIKVEGSLVVYAFDETHRDPTDVRPDKKYVFTAEQVAKHYSKSKLGHSYSFWLPWGAVGEEQKEISLIVRFSPVQGGVVVGDQSLNILPGPKPVDASIRPKKSNSVEEDISSNRGNREDSIQPVSHEESYDDAAEDENDLHNHSEREAKVGNAFKRLRTSTIELPSRPGSLVPKAAVRSRNLPASMSIPGQSSGDPEGRGETPGVSRNSSATRESASTVSTHYGPRRSRPLGEPISRLERADAPRGLDREGWRFDPATPRGLDPATSLPPALQDGGLNSAK